MNIMSGRENSNHPAHSVIELLVRVRVSIGCVFVPAFTVNVRGGRVLLGFFVFIHFVVVSRFEVVMGSGVVMRGGLMVMIRCRVLLLVSHGIVPCEREVANAERPHSLNRLSINRQICKWQSASGSGFLSGNPSAR